MAIKPTLVILAFALAIGSSGGVQLSALDSAVNELCNQTLGAPCKSAPPSSIAAPPPPPPVQAPSVPPTLPPITLPPITLPPIQIPTVPSPPPVQAPSVPPTLPPITLPPITLPPITLPPIQIPTVPAQAPGPSQGSASGLLYVYSNRTLTADDIEKLADLINKQLKNIGSVLFTPGTVKAIDGKTTTPIVATASDIQSCPEFAAALLSYSSFIADANAANIPLTYMQLTKVTCLGAGTPIDFDLAALPPPSGGPNGLSDLAGLLG